ncbi:high-affinity iron permease [Conoideocrella luteorostrata]|uniref:High-affinity iron permease n=1 Tax=Conoideocrella luteorostrata TaxID=1105319 RepID=A0AAJ0CC51_9HYPO|nr:high-affinity iron permease [Conoideocrella luteorostrata]
MTVNVFSVPIFLVVLRETIEAGIIVSILLAFLKQMRISGTIEAKTYKSLVIQVWVGAILGFLVCLIVGGAVIGIFYRFGRNLWNSAEYIYQGVFYLVAALVITVVGVVFLRIGKLQEKWRNKIDAALQKNTKSEKNVAGSVKRKSKKYAVFFLSFITVAREGIEGVVFVSGVTFAAPVSSIPLPVVVGLMGGCIVGWILYKGASLTKIRYFLVASSCLLYLVAAGLVARSVWYFEQGHWSNVVGADVGEAGTGPGSYDIDRSVWHVNRRRELGMGWPLRPGTTSQPQTGELRG